MPWYFFFFFLSGFCSILYELVWLRLAMAQFGVTTAMVSIVLSAFMGGLGLGSWASGFLVRKYDERIQFPPLRLYAIMELLIGVAALMAPWELLLGRGLLQRTISQFSISSSGYYLASGIGIALILLPWCACIGATFPFAMLAIKRGLEPGRERSFSYLYLANVLGAIAGATVPMALIEWLGFHRTLYVGATLNLLLASCAFALTLGQSVGVRATPDSAPPRQGVRARDSTDRKSLWLLFGTGLTSMGVEVIWIRLFTPSLSTVVYAFAAILALYLSATYFGSWIYRRPGRKREFESTPLLWVALGFSVLVPLLSVDPRVPLPALFRVLVGVAPFSVLVGFVTPMIVDRYSEGDPDLAGSAYATNVFGCVIGPLISGFLLLPRFGERSSLCLFALPWLLVGFTFGRFGFPRRVLAAVSVLVLASLALVLSTESFEEQFSPRKVFRDNTATVVATGSGRGKHLLVNGVGMTSLTPITKIMAHLPLAYLTHPPENVLIICFGMGTTHRSALSWHIKSTAVELVASVPKLFSFFHLDAQVLISSPLSRVVIDDGRSYLKRTLGQYDMILLDPPPPTGAASSSLLYSEEFYAVAKPHLKQGGILQQWLPGGDAATEASVARALEESFTYVRAFRSIDGYGYHFLASMSPIPSKSAAQLAQSVPADAIRDLLEWGPKSTAEQQFQAMLDSEVAIDTIARRDPNAPALRDDRPVNEYFLFRRLNEPGYLKKMVRQMLGWDKLY
jgi:predicted membrane-bound spermidine synthase